MSICYVYICSIGDTGGPLICNDIGVPYFAGVSSYGHMCGQPGHPGVYTEVSKYMSWIENPYEF